MIKNFFIKICCGLLSVILIFSFSSCSNNKTIYEGTWVRVEEIDGELVKQDGDSFTIRGDSIKFNIKSWPARYNDTYKFEVIKYDVSNVARLESPKNEEIQYNLGLYDYIEDTGDMLEAPIFIDDLGYEFYYFVRD